ncbi:polysaccharide pyruvyl transferase [Thioclava sp. F1Mire-8]|uniref:polysaccharide pyruvyl transferase family protein n=1 Tax=Thioclava sp. F1Mire-8 TaxID=1973006 RepID=UPI000B53ABBE|nr:polysaccharide pyruvyl transferase family protein [Thioclava sp. F1Mire-8]OWY01821.1 polysaccharide pyruvyl transferase [Thioclava sp. F1Mire-8]
MSRTLRVCMIFHSTRSDNLGVGALTVSEIALLRDLATKAGREIAITVLDWKDRRAPYVAGDDLRLIEVDGAFLKSPKGLWAEVKAADLVIDIGGGDSFADIYGTSRLVKMFWMKFATHLAGTPLVVAPQTVGPFTKGWSKRLARMSLNRSALVAVRDERSRAALDDLGYRGAPVLASDLALRLPYDPPVPCDGGPVRVGVNVSGLLMAGGYHGSNDFGMALDYPALIARAIDWFKGQGAEVHLVPHVIVPEGPMVIEDDLRACETLAAEHDAICAPAFASPSEAKSYIAGLDFFTGARMHACIAAFSAGVAVVPLAYSRKFAGLFGALGYDHTVDATTADTDTVMAALERGFANRETLAAEAQSALARGIDRLAAYDAALLNLMKAL